MICIIGGAGFIGSRLCNRLNDDKISFKILDKVKSPFFPDKTVIMDIRYPESYKSELIGAKVVINLAAEHRDDITPKSLYDEVNVDGTKRLTEVCEELNINQIIFTSSVAVYGFALRGTDETGEINYFNDYGRTKWEAEKVLQQWYEKDSESRILTIIRPTVVFGERNRGNVYNLLRQIAGGFFPMIGDGKNIKSMAYVENIAAFLQFNIKNTSGIHLFNYIDKPDFDMNGLVIEVRKALNKKLSTGFHWPYFLGYFGGLCFDLLAAVSRRKFSVSRIRIKKFCSDTMFNAENIKKTNFVPPVPLCEGIQRTIKYEFIDIKNTDEVLFYTE